MSEQIVKLTSKPHWLKGRGFKHRRFKLKAVHADRGLAEIHGPIVWDVERGWLPAPDHPAASDHFVDADQIEWCD